MDDVVQPGRPRSTRPTSAPFPSTRAGSEKATVSVARLALPPHVSRRYLRERHARARLGDEQVATIKGLTAQPGGPAKVLVIAEDWSSDCRRDLPYLARLAEAGGLELRLFLRDAETMHRQGLPEPGSYPNADLVREYANDKNGQKAEAMLDSV